MELLKLLNTNELVAQIACFLLFLLIMRTFLWKKFLAILDKRRDTFSSELKRIEEAKSTLSRIKSEYENKLSGIDAEAQVKIREAMARADELADEIIAKAELGSENIINSARAALKDELTKAMDELKNDVVSLSIQIAEKVVQEKLSVESDRALVEDFIKGIDKK